MDRPELLTLTLSKPNQDLCRDLNPASVELEEAAQALFKLAKVSDPESFLEVMERIEGSHSLADRLVGYADEMKVGSGL